MISKWIPICLYNYFFCLWDSFATFLSYCKRHWLIECEIPVLGRIGDLWENQGILVESEKALMPPLYIRVRLVKHFMKALNNEGESLKYISIMFPRLSKTEIEGIIFTGPDVRKLLLSQQFERKK